ncbi:hypothetical protein Pmani_015642 [Petrolisthes manimaculis]|uniref:Uncharacterized protein n=1 Tax=Petrolisthes manimaculis TaxID=1843537 RepID=A0AAE1U7H8_9EUCA|nr:hypothetical protein Pmani_015642 [Petrolisthes manimaculis]
MAGCGVSADRGATHRLIETSEVSLYREVYSKLHFLPRSEIMALVAGGEYSFICLKTPIEFTMVTKFSKVYAETRFHVAQEEFFPGGYTWGFPKGSPYRKIIDRMMGRCVMSGLTRKWLGDTYSLYQREYTEERSTLEPEEALTSSDNGLVVLGIVHFQGPFFILFLGAGGGVLLLLLELLTSRL